jgi:uncharacterized protein (DUF433 family)
LQGYDFEAMMERGFSLKEAAAIAGVPEPAVRKAIESRTLRPRKLVTGRSPRYRLAIREMLYLKLLAEMPLALDKEDKADLRALVERRHDRAGRWQAEGRDYVVRAGDVTLRVEVGPLRSALAHNLLSFRRGRRRIISDPAILNGEPVFEGTRIPLAHIAGLIAKGVSPAEIAEDYPALDSADLAYAALHSRIKRDPGRPRKPLQIDLRDAVTA